MKMSETSKTSSSSDIAAASSTASSSSSNECDETKKIELMKKAEDLISQGKRNMVCGEVPKAVNAFEEAVKMLVGHHGEMSPSCAPAYYHCGCALLELCRMESSVLGSALDGVEVEEEKEMKESEQFEKPPQDDDDEREKLREQVYEAMSEEQRLKEKSDKKDSDKSVTEKNDKATPNGQTEESMDIDSPKEKNDASETKDEKKIDKENSDQTKVNDTDDSKVKKQSNRINEKDMSKEEKDVSKKIEMEDSIKKSDIDEQTKNKDTDDSKEKIQLNGINQKEISKEEKDVSKNDEKDVSKNVEKDVKKENGEKNETSEKEKDESLKKAENNKASKKEEKPETNGHTNGDENEKCKENLVNCSTENNEMMNEKEKTNKDASDDSDAKSKKLNDENKVNGDHKKASNEDQEKDDSAMETDDAKADKENHTAEDEGEEEEDGSEGEEDDGGEDVSHFQLAWEYLDVAKVIFMKMKDNEKENQLKSADCLIKLGELSMENEQHETAASDLEAALKIQKQHLEPHDRVLAETHYQLGLAYSLAQEFEKAIQAYQDAISVIEAKIVSLNKMIEESDKEKDSEAVTKYKKEIKDLEELVPEMKNKIEDVKSEQKDKDKMAAMARQMLGLSGTSKGFGSPKKAAQNGSSGEGAASSSSVDENGEVKAKPIQMLVRKKRKPEDEVTPDSTQEIKKSRQEEGGAEAKTNGVNGDSSEAETKPPVTQSPKKTVSA